YWEGWAYSNVKDNVTTGPDNQYASFAPYTPAAGSNGSSNYAVAYATPFVLGGTFVELPVGFNPVSVRITNPTYAASPMRDGGLFNAKVFGGPTGNDPDFFTLTITGKDADGHVTGHVDFRLADYTFANNSLDYIVSDWTNVNLSSLGEARQL